MISNNRPRLAHVSLAFLLAATALVSGCALGTTNVNVGHRPLAPVLKAKQGNILVKPFVDKRPDTQHIGYKRNGFAMPLGRLGIAQNEKLETILTRDFAEALQAAGYTVTIEQPGSPASPAQPFDAVVGGEIRNFWTDLYLVVWHKVDVHLSATEKEAAIPVWERDIRARKTNVLWLGIVPEFEKVIRDALTRALNQAAQEFASDEFARSIAK